jgi:DNA-directed RNA polymerase specialized sigma24 family protein
MPRRFWAGSGAADGPTGGHEECVHGTLHFNGFAVRIDMIRRTVNKVCHSWGFKDVDDVFAEVLLLVHMQNSGDSSRFTREAGVLAFARQHAVYELKHIFRKRRRKRRVEFIDPQELHEPAIKDDETTREREQLLSLLSDCERVVSLLSMAKPLVREVFRLHCEGMSRQDICHKLNISLSSYGRCLGTAYKILRRKLGDN